MNLVSVLKKLLGVYGDIALPEPREPFELVVWGNCAYLVDDDRRARTFESLKRAIGIKPNALLAAGAKKIEKAITEGGMQPSHRAAKVMRCAELALEHADNEITRKYLKQFPGMADPGADKILLLCGLSDAPALDSNGLRVLERLGLVPSGLAYAAGYKLGVAAVAAAKAAPVEAFALLREHGRQLCKRSAPLCPTCPLVKLCPYPKIQ